MSENRSQRDLNKVGAVMVVGGGICGMQSALDLADSGFKVYLVEEGPSIGGRMAQLDKTFPTNDCSMCMISPKLIEVSKHRNIEIISNADVVKTEGEPGRFKVTVRKRARSVDESLCTGCGSCYTNCPVRYRAYVPGQQSEEGNNGTGSD
jgi:heterodisulfide reductase subunit A